VKTCASAAEGIAAVSAFRPHVIVADIGMPEDDGYVFVRTLRALRPDEGGLIPAAALTPAGHDDEADRALQSGFQTCVRKPVEPHRLVAAMTTLASDIVSAASAGRSTATQTGKPGAPPENGPASTSA
jgi:CheY-like chemotaxis protein